MLLLGGSLPLLLTAPAWAQTCTEVEIKKNIENLSNSNINSVQQAALDALIKCSSQSIQPLIVALQDRNADIEIRGSSAFALGLIGSGSQEAVNSLIAVVQEQQADPYVRRKAASALGQIASGSTAAVNALIATLQEETANPYVRGDAASALGKIGSNSATIKALIATLQKQKADARIGSPVANALGKIGSGSMEEINALIDALQDQKADAKVRRSAAVALGEIGSTIEKHKERLSPEELKQVISGFKQAHQILEADRDAKIFTQKQLRDVGVYLQSFEQKQQSRWREQIIQKFGTTWLLHCGFWLVLIFLYPKSPQVQAIFFWNPKVRKFFGFGYVGFALTWIPFLRSKLLEPFKESLLSDAELENFDPQAYFADSEVKLKGGKETKPIRAAIPEIKGEIVLEGESGLGKSMFLRNLVQSSRRIVVYLPAKKCAQGVIEAIQAKLHGPAKDPDFLQNLIYSGAIDICIDGLNEVTPDTRAKITGFVESYFKGNIIMATQPLEWMPPSTANTYILQPLRQDRIEEFLLSRQVILPADAQISGVNYAQACQNYLATALNSQQSPEEQVAVRRMLSNPMELTVIAQMLGSGKKPDLLNLQQQWYEIMAADYERVHPGKKFPLEAFSEMVYQMRLEDKADISAEQWSDELQCMERYKMVLMRQVVNAEGKAIPEWHFRHDKVMEFFIVQKFLGEENELPNKHISDPRFRGVYFLLANLLPMDAAMKLRERLIQHAATTQDHTVSDRFIRLLLSRQAA